MKRRKFTKEFKQEALSLISEGRYSVAEAAERLGVGSNVLYKWRREQATGGTQAFRGNGVVSDEQRQIKELESEVRRLRMERDFLKKTAAYFAKDGS